MTAATLSPLPEDKQALVTRLAEGLDTPALHWLSGYFAGVAVQRQGGGKSAAIEPAAATDTQTRLTVLYGSQTGNAKRIAEDLGRRATAAGLAVRIVRADAYVTRELKQERLLYVVISTQGDAEPPDDARAFVEFLSSSRAPKLDELHYAVLGLGDSSYPQFCAIGRQVDERLAALGGARLFSAGEADVDLESVSQPWLEHALQQAREQLKTATPLAKVTPLRTARNTPTWHREQPFAAPLLLNQRITGRDSDRDVRHLELSLEGSGLRYAPGDALGVWPTQAAALVEAILATTKLNGDAPVQAGGEERSLRLWLAERRELTQLTRPFFAAHAERSGDAALRALLEPVSRDALSERFSHWQVIDLLRRHPADWTPESLVAALRPLAPRLYSIASSQSVVGDEVHLTLSHVDYALDGEARWGAASRYLAHRAEGETVPVFIEANERFHLPADERDIIMIGPGTGVAPFRAFVQERAERGASGRNWLLFGNPHFHSDFLYQTEWQQALKNSQLHRIDLAFSRDQAEKIYVQHRLREQGRDLYEWLDSGAHLYVCGDATRMAKDVHKTLIDIVAEHSARTAEDAETWLNQLIQQGRYARDVY
ncbi:assimilatory sulfite reductase (NADPH) flavoprotein subunit [Dyella caseinilytica]|uniref:Sulfite reductase [NADPH] flavoprotein alpha-component n=1 Tax=Dyella caseinilytica TaxID=1849581 RepID=A0ABX7GUQ5_9GAMM|nr:assimilatory sulfite reductase (NADPH) flavoprotein subunit [Dyella caseinilytica]QRN54172.1 assimilatory sulfite reductase (NADPH) flavoprotein subunit [Dyella caseinilytica]GFZ92097.1 sulfite reductase [NADPH] flavoprotein alpha-component [Dyella caseinilytica]